MLKLELGAAAASDALRRPPPIPLEARRGGSAGAADAGGVHGENEALTRALTIRVGGASGSEEQRQLVERLNASKLVFRGAMLTKFVLGKRKRHLRHVRVHGADGKLSWGSNEGVALRAHADAPHGLKKEQKLTDDELLRVFQVDLKGKLLVLMAPTTRERNAWVLGINAVVSGLVGGSARGSARGAAAGGAGRGPVDAN